MGRWMERSKNLQISDIPTFLKMDSDPGLLLIAPILKAVEGSGGKSVFVDEKLCNFERFPPAEGGVRRVSMKSDHPTEKFFNIEAIRPPFALALMDRGFGNGRKKREERSCRMRGSFSGK